MTFEVLGTGCAKCKATLDLIQRAADARGTPVDLPKVERIDDIIARGVMTTPAVVHDGRVLVAGRVPSRREVDAWLAPGGPANPQR